MPGPCAQPLSHCSPFLLSTPTLLLENLEAENHFWEEALTLSVDGAGPHKWEKESHGVHTAAGVVWQPKSHLLWHHPSSHS